MLKYFCRYFKSAAILAILAAIYLASSVALPLALAQQSALATTVTTNSTGTELPVPAPIEAKPAPQADSAQNSGIDLVIKSFLLSQGEDGSTLWRLKAISGKMHKESDMILIDQPALVYYLPPDNKELFVSSDRGEVIQAKKHIRFLENVLLTHNNSTITSDELIYNGNTRTMTIPRGGVLEGPKMSGRADKMIWNLATRTLECIGSVETVFISHDDPLGQPAVTLPSETPEKKD